MQPCSTSPLSAGPGCPSTIVQALHHSDTMFGNPAGHAICIVTFQFHADTKAAQISTVVPPAFQRHVFHWTDGNFNQTNGLHSCRYNPNKGLLTLTSERYQQREENRLHITQMLRDLVQEGQRAYPCEDKQQDAPVRETVG
jgi:hypothetical protein